MAWGRNGSRGQGGRELLALGPWFGDERCGEGRAGGRHGNGKDPQTAWRPVTEAGEGGGSWVRTPR